MVRPAHPIDVQQAKVPQTRENSRRQTLRRWPEYVHEWIQMDEH